MTIRIILFFLAIAIHPGVSYAQTAVKENAIVQKIYSIAAKKFENIYMLDANFRTMISAKTGNAGYVKVPKIKLDVVLSGTESVDGIPVVKIIAAIPIDSELCLRGQCDKSGTLVVAAARLIEKSRWAGYCNEDGYYEIIGSQYLLSFTFWGLNEMASGVIDATSSERIKKYFTEAAENALAGVDYRKFNAGSYSCPQYGLGGNKVRTTMIFEKETGGEHFIRVD